MSNFPVSDEAIQALRLKLLRALAASTHPAHALGAVAGNNDLTIDDAKALVTGYGYPDHKEMKRYIFELDRPGTTSQPAPRPAQPRSIIPHPEPNDRTEGLLVDAEASPNHRTRNLAARIRKLIGELADLVQAEKKERQITEAEERRRAELTAEVAELEAALAAKKAALKPIAAKKTAAPRRSDSKAIREWAAKHSVTCPAVGRVPHDVVEAYDLATNSERTAS